MNFIQRYWVLLVVGAFIFFFMLGNEASNNSVTPSSVNNEPEEVNLNQVLVITVDTIYAFQNKYGQNLQIAATGPTDKSELDTYATWAFVDELQTAYNDAVPAINDTNIGVQPLVDASFIAFEDRNNDGEWSQNSENSLFQIEIDGAQSRVIATSDYGAVNEYRVSGMPGFFTGYFIGSLMDRQRGAGISSSKLAAKKPISAKAAARSRAGSGSYRRGK